MDRFDCQFLMATFVHVYHSSFIRFAHKYFVCTIGGSRTVLYFTPLSESRRYSLSLQKKLPEFTVAAYLLTGSTF